MAVHVPVGRQAPQEPLAIPTPERYQQPGWYPSAYRIMWDESAREYRISLTRLSKQG